MEQQQTNLDQIDIFQQQHEEELERKRMETLKPVTLHSFKVVGDDLRFKNEYREDFVTFLRQWPGRLYTGTHNSVPVGSWWQFVTEVKKLPKVSINLTPEEALQISKWRPESELTISLEDNQKDFKIKVKRGGRSWLINNISAAKVVTNDESREYPGMIYRLPTYFGWQLLGVIKEYEPTVSWSQDAHDLTANQLAQRAKVEELLLNEEEIPLYSYGDHILRRFQAVGMQFLLMNDCSGLVGDDMGLGKTPQGLAAIETYRKEGKIKKVLIFCPATLRYNIAREVNKWTGESPMFLLGEKPDRFQVEKWLRNEYVYYIMSYDSIGTRIKNPDRSAAEEYVYPWVTALNILPADAVIADEIHYIKNTDSARSQAVRRVEARYKIGLSGTIMPNRPNELYAPVKWVQPDLIGSEDAFTKRYMYADGTARNAQELKELIKPIFLRRKKLDVIKDLDPINRIIREHELSLKAKNAYNEIIVNGLRPALIKFNPSNSSSINNVLTQLVALKQVCAYDKVNAVADLAIECYDNNTTNWRKVIILSQFSERPPMIREIAALLGHEAVSFSGSVSHKERMRIADQFRDDPDIKYLVASIQTAQEGLNNLVAAGTVIFTDLTWTPKDHQQAEGRAYGRMNELHSIDSYYMIAINSVEDTHVMPKIEAKIATIEEVVDGSQDRFSGGGSIINDILHDLKHGGLGLIK